MVVAATAPASVATVVDFVLHSQLLCMEWAAANHDPKTLKRVTKGRWMHGVFTGLSAFFDNYPVMIVDTQRWVGG